METRPFEEIVMSEISANPLASRTIGMSGPAPAFTIAQAPPLSRGELIHQISRVLSTQSGRIEPVVEGNVTRGGAELTTVFDNSPAGPNTNGKVALYVTQDERGRFSGKIAYFGPNDQAPQSLSWVIPPQHKAFHSRNPADFAAAMLQDWKSANYARFR